MRLINSIVLVAVLARGCGYADHWATSDETREYNLSQSGVQNVQYPLYQRQEFAKKHGLAVPAE